jgi:hypothetical protein
VVRVSVLAFLGLAVYLSTGCSGRHGSVADSGHQSVADSGHQSVADSGHDSGAGDGGSASDALWPFSIGRTWTYQITGICAGTFTRTVLQAGTVDGRSAFEVSGCSENEWYAPGPGNEVDVDVLGTWLTLIDPMIEDGHSWSYGGYTTLTWKDAGTVTVPAGAFTDCWTAVPSSATYPASTYCRGVGPVHVSSESSDQILTATSANGQ